MLRTGQVLHSVRLVSTKICFFCIYFLRSCDCLAFILGVLFLRDVGVVGHREPKPAPTEEEERQKIDLDARKALGRKNLMVSLVPLTVGISHAGS